jgi:predicted ATPase with chaperone activity
LNPENMMVAPPTQLGSETVAFAPEDTGHNAEEPLLGESADPFRPPFPQSIDQLGVSPTFLHDLALKAMALEPTSTSAEIAARLHLGVAVTDHILQRLTRDKLIEIKGVVGTHNHRYSMLDRGWTEAARISAHNSYLGPAPVSLEAYTDRLTAQIRSRPPATRAALDAAMKDLVLTEGAKQTLGLVASSGRSLFLSGPSGNGKTAMARALVHAIHGELWIPYAIEIDGQVIRLFDPHTHQPVETENGDHDRRWIKIKPPLVVVGGELTLESMELTRSPAQRFYEAPFQLKSNGGVLVVDDLGRQRCSAAQLLNRWIIPLEHRVDYLTLDTGKKIQVPFEQTIIFATNLTVSDLADEAFLRRMGYRLYVMPPGPDTYAEIFIRYARKHGLAVEPGLLAHLEQRYGREHREPKACEPRDLIDRAIEVCRYNRETIRLTREILDLAWDGYFGATASG